MRLHDITAIEGNVQIAKDVARHLTQFVDENDDKELYAELIAPEMTRLPTQ